MVTPQGIALRHPRTLTPTLSQREREKSTTSQTKMDGLLAFDRAAARSCASFSFSFFTSAS